MKKIHMDKLMFVVLPAYIVLLSISLFAQDTLALDSGTIAPDTVTNTTIIEPGDVLEIMILGEEGLSRTVMVMHSGNISYPLIGDMRVEGLTSDQATGLLSKRLKKYFNHPIVSVIFKSASTPHVSVFGEVIRPGALEYQRGLRLTDYIALAGGTSRNGNLSQVKVIRFDRDRPVTEVVDVSAIIQKGSPNNNYVLKSGDWLYIPYRTRLNWSAIFQVVTLSATLINLIIVLRRL